jgi:hypothetical protein
MTSSIPKLRLLLALAVALGASACGDPAAKVEEVTSIVVVHVSFDDTALELHQIRVAAHLGDEGVDSTLTFPDSRTPARIPSGATLALLIPTTRMGHLDLILSGLDAGGNAIARGNGQTTLAIGERVDVTISLTACPASGC